MGRYHLDAYYGTQIPGLNQRLFNEIEFYIIEPSQDFQLTQDVKGVFLGTDYDFIHNAKMRVTIFRNCLESDSLYLHFKPHEN